MSADSLLACQMYPYFSAYIFKVCSISNWKHSYNSLKIIASCIIVMSLSIIKIPSKKMQTIDFASHISLGNYKRKISSMIDPIADFKISQSIRKCARGQP